MSHNNKDTSFLRKRQPDCSNHEDEYTTQKKQNNSYQGNNNPTNMAQPNTFYQNQPQAQNFEAPLNVPYQQYNQFMTNNNDNSNMLQSPQNYMPSSYIMPQPIPPYPNQNNDTSVPYGNNYPFNMNMFNPYMYYNNQYQNNFYNNFNNNTNTNTAENAYENIPMNKFIRKSFDQKKQEFMTNSNRDTTKKKIPSSPNQKKKRKQKLNEKSKKQKLQDDQEFPTMNDAYNVPAQPKIKKKKRKRNKKNTNNLYTIPRLKLKQIYISKKITEELEKKKNPKQKKKNTDGNEDQNDFNKKHLKATKGSTYKLIEGVIEKGIQKKVKISRMKKSKDLFNKFNETKGQQGNINEYVQNTHATNNAQNKVNEEQEIIQKNISESYSNNCDNEVNKDTHKIEKIVDQAIEKTSDNLNFENIDKITDELYGYCEIEKQSYYSSLRYKKKLMFNNSDIVREGYGNSIEIREWVDHMLTNDLDTKVLTFINNLSYRQVQKRKIQPLKYKKRLAIGFKEVNKSLKSFQKEKMAKMIIFGVDIKKNPLENGTDTAVREIFNLCEKNDIPYVFSGTRREIGAAIYGKVLARPVKIAAIAVIDIMGYESEFKDIEKNHKAMKILFKDKYAEFISKDQFNDIKH